MTTTLIARQIRRGRELKGFSQRQLAERVGVRKATICAWETARQEPRYTHIARLLHALEMPCEWFFDSRPPRV